MKYLKIGDEVVINWRTSTDIGLVTSKPFVSGLTGSQSILVKVGEKEKAPPLQLVSKIER